MGIDPRFGTLKPSGERETWPEVDVNGKPYDKAFASYGVLSDGVHFVALPPRWDGDLSFLTVDAPLVAPKIEPPAPDPAG